MTATTFSQASIYSFCSTVHSLAYKVDIPESEQSKIAQLAREILSAISTSAGVSAARKITLDATATAGIKNIAALKKRMGLHHTFSTAADESTIFTAIDSLSSLVARQQTKSDKEAQIKLLSLILAKDKEGLHNFLDSVKTHRFVKTLIDCFDELGKDEFESCKVLLAQYFVLMPKADQKIIARVLNQALLNKWDPKTFSRVITLKQDLWLKDNPISIQKMIDLYLQNAKKKLSPKALIDETRTLVSLTSGYVRSIPEGSVSVFGLFDFLLLHSTLTAANANVIVSLIETVEKMHPGFIALLCEKNPSFYMVSLVEIIDCATLEEDRKKFIFNATCLNNPELEGYFTDLPINIIYKSLIESCEYSQRLIDRILGDGICFGVCIQTIHQKSPINKETERLARWHQSRFYLNTLFYLQSRPSKLSHIEEKNRLLQSLALKSVAYEVEKIDKTFAKKLTAKLKVSRATTQYILCLGSKEKFTANHVIHIGTDPFVVTDPTDMDPKNLLPKVHNFTSAEELSDFLAVRIFFDYACNPDALYNLWNLSALSHVPVLKPKDCAPLALTPQIGPSIAGREALLIDTKKAHLARSAEVSVPRFTEKVSSKRFSFLTESEADREKAKCEEFFLSKITSLRSEHFATVYALAESLCSWIGRDPATRFAIAISHWHEMPGTLQKRLLQSLIANSSELEVVKALLLRAEEKKKESNLKEVLRHLTASQVFTILDLWSQKKLSNQEFKLFATITRSAIEKLVH